MNDLLVLCYHAVSVRWPADLAVTPPALERQLRSLVERGYAFTTFRRAVSSPIRGRTAVVTFDDGFRSVVESAFPIMSALGIPGTIFVCTEPVDGGGPLSWAGIEHWLGSEHGAELVPVTWDDLRLLHQAGWEIGSHTRTHPLLTSVDSSVFHSELQGSRARIEEALGVDCRSLAYPYGQYDDRVVAAAAAAGYVAACALPARLKPGHPLAWPRVGVYRGDDGRTFRLKTSHPLRRLRASPIGSGVDRFYRSWGSRAVEQGGYTEESPGAG